MLDLSLLNVDSIRSSRPEVALLLDSSPGSKFIFGGALRDWGSKSNMFCENDIDIVVDCDPQSLEEFMQTAICRHTRNKFGGYRFVWSGSNIDMWRLDDTVNIKNNKADSLIETTFISSDSISLNWQTDKLARIEGPASPMLLDGSNMQAFIRKAVNTIINDGSVDVLMEQCEYVSVEKIKKTSKYKTCNMG